MWCNTWIILFSLLVSPNFTIVKNITFLAAILLIGAISFTSCDDNDCVEGMGSTVTVDLDLPEVHSVIANGAFNITFEQAPEQRIQAVGQQNIIDDLSLDVSGGVWDMELDENCYRNFELTIRIFVPDVNSIEINGSNDVVINSFDSLDALVIESSGSGVIFQSGTLNIEGMFRVLSSGSANVTANFNAGQTEVEITGSGDIKFDGTTDSFNIDIDGSGNINAFGLQTSACDIDIRGAGNVNVNVSDTLNVKISGSGSVCYRGDPEVDSEITGSGDVSKC